MFEEFLLLDNPPSAENQVLYCEFNEPKTWENLPPTSKLDFWNYSEIKCYSEISEIISNPANTTSTFYLNKTFSYGDFFIIFFLSVFTLFFLFNFIIKFIYKLKVSWRHN